jgi:glucose-6-phosphate dehydrogenase assembly protein OpcA
MLTDIPTALLGQEVPVARIDGELKKLWEIDNAPTRASLINFALYSETTESIERNVQSIQEITQDHACRSILITSLPHEPQSHVRSWITAHCQLDSAGNKTVCSEQIAFLVTHDCGGLIRNIVFAHLDSDLPLIFWWQGDLADRFEHRLYSRIDRLVIDSDSWSDLPAGINLLHQALTNSHAHFVVHDLAWTRTYHMRLAIAAAFENPALNNELANLRSVSITASPQHQATALFLLAWLASRLEIDFRKIPSDSSDTTQRFEGRKWDPTASLTLSESNESIALLEIRFENGSYSIEHSPDSRFLRMRTEVPDFTREKLMPADPTKESELIVDQLMRGGSNSLYHAIVPTFASLL